MATVRRSYSWAEHNEFTDGLWTAFPWIDPASGLTTWRGCAVLARMALRVACVCEFQFAAHCSTAMCIPRQPGDSVFHLWARQGREVPAYRGTLSHPLAK